MRKETQAKKEIGDCIIHYRKAPRRWAIVVMPDKFKVDNYYHGVHVHHDRKESLKKVL